MSFVSIVSISLPSCVIVFVKLLFCSIRRRKKNVIEGENGSDASSDDDGGGENDEIDE